MPSYLLEFFAPVGAADRVTEAGRNIQVIAVPEDETVFWLMEASSRDELNRLLAQRGLTPERIVEAIRLENEEEK